MHQLPLPFEPRQRRPKHSPNQAKLLTEEEYAEVERHVRNHPKFAMRNLVCLRLSHYAGLRAHEIAGVEWKRHLLDASGRLSDTLLITTDIAKGGAGGPIPLSTELKSALGWLRAQRPDDFAVVHPLQGSDMARRKTSAASIHKFFERLYEDCGLEGATSHTGRRSAITRLARRHALVGASMRDVQLFARHRSLETTQGYIEAAPPSVMQALVNV